MTAHRRQLLEATPTVSASYEALLQPLLSAVLWERLGNVPGLVRLLQAYARRAPALLVVQLVPTLGVFQQLLALKATEHEAFVLLEALVEFVDPGALAPHLVAIFQLIFSRLKFHKSPKLVKSFLIFLALFFGKHDPSEVARQIDAVENR